MAKRPGKRPRDLNSLAASVVDDATSDEPAFSEIEKSQQVRAGELGGRKRRAGTRRALIGRGAQRDNS